MSPSESLSRVMGIALPILLIEPLRDAASNVITHFQATGDQLGAFCMTGASIVGATYLVTCSALEARRYGQKIKEDLPPIIHE